MQNLLSTQEADDLCAICVARGFWASDPSLDPFCKFTSSDNLQNPFLWKVSLYFTKSLEVVMPGLHLVYFVPQSDLA